MTAPRGGTGGTLTRGRAGKKLGWQQPFLEALAKHGTVTKACDAAGVGRTTAYRERQADEEFALAWADIDSQVTEKLEGKAVQMALAGDGKMLEFLLKARKPEQYRESYKVEHSGSIKTDLSSMTDAELQALADGLDAKRAGAS